MIRLPPAKSHLVPRTAQNDVQEARQTAAREDKRDTHAQITSRADVGGLSEQRVPLSLPRSKQPAQQKYAAAIPAIPAQALENQDDEGPSPKLTDAAWGLFRLFYATPAQTREGSAENVIYEFLKRPKSDGFEHFDTNESLDVISRLGTEAGEPRGQVASWDVAVADKTMMRLLQRLEFPGLAWPELKAEVLRGSQDAFRHQGLAQSVAGSALALCLHLDSTQLTWLKTSGVANALYRLPLPSMRPGLLQGLAALARSEPSRTAYEQRTVLRLEKRLAAGALFSVVCAQLQGQGCDMSPLTLMLDKKGFKVFRDGPKLELLLQSLQGLCNHDKLSSADRRSLIEQLLAQPEPLQVLEKARLLALVVEVGSVRILRDPTASLSQKGEQTLQKLLGDLDVVQPMERFAATFGKSRAPLAVARYLTSLQTLNDPSEAILAARLYATEVMQGAFARERMNIEHNEHLRALEAQMPGVLQAWVKPISQDVNGLTLPQAWNALTWLTVRILHDDHLPGVRERLPELVQFLEGHAEDDGIYARLCDSGSIPVGDSVAQAWRQVAQGCAVLARSAPEHHLTALLGLARAAGALPHRPELLHDATSQIAALTSEVEANASSSTLALETADPIHLLLCGTDVPGSCQRIDGDPQLSKGLLGYLLNGQTRLLAVINPITQTIKARQIFRLLSDGSKPVLFVERVYGDESYAPALEKLALRKAKEMRLVLTREDRTRGAASYPEVLHSYGGRSPFEYCDSAGGVEEKSKFSIKNVVVVQPGLSNL